MNAKLIKFGKFAVASLSVVVLTNSMTSIATLPLKAIAIPITATKVNNQNLVGTWRATDESIQKYYETSAEGQMLKHMGGDYIYTFDSNGQVRIIMKDVTMGIDDMPTPMVMNGNALFSWQASGGNTLNLEPIGSFSFKGEYMGMEVPVQNDMAPNKTLNYKLEGNTLRLTNVPGDDYYYLELKRV